MRELHVCRTANHTRIDTHLNARIGWLNDMRNKNYGGSWRSYDINEPITEQIRRNCHEFVDFLIKHKEHHKLVVSVNWGWMYVNDLKIVQELSRFVFVNLLKQEEAIVAIPRGSIRLVNSPYKYRSYFRSKRLTEDQRKNLITFINSNPEIRVSPAFDNWVKRNWGTWVRESYFIDYDSEYILTMLELTCSGVIRKTLDIVNDK